MAAAATKISAVYKGNKDREKVRELKAQKESGADGGDGNPAAEGEQAKADEPAEGGANDDAA